MNNIYEIIENMKLGNKEQEIKNLVDIAYIKGKQDQMDNELEYLRSKNGKIWSIYRQR